MAEETISMLTGILNDDVKCSAFLSDEGCLGGLVMLLSNGNTGIVTCALKIFGKLSCRPENQLRLAKFIGMKEQLQNLRDSNCETTKNLANFVYSQLFEGIEMPLHDSTNRQNKPARRNSMLMRPGNVKGKTVVLQIRGLVDKYDMDLCRQQLLTVKGVISITFDMSRKRSVCRTKVNINPQLLAEAIAKTMTMSADLVVRSETGEETVVSLLKNQVDLSKENLPDYPSEISPDRKAITSQRVASPESSRKWEFVKTIGTYLSNNFYW